MISFKAADDIFSTFGDLIQNIQIEFDFLNVEQGSEVIKFINDKSFESLKTLDLVNCHGNVLDNSKTTFTKVTTLTLSRNKRKKFIIDENQKMIQHFPSLEALHLENIKTSDWTFIDGGLASLKLLTLNIPDSKDGHDFNEFLVDFIKKNTQIDALRIHNVNLKLLHEIEVILRNLKTLDIFSLSENYSNGDQDEEIHFNSIRNLFINSANKIPEKIPFEQAENFTLRIKPVVMDGWIEFLQQINTNLKIFTLYTNYLRSEHLTVIALNFPQLQMVIIECWSTLNADDVSSFIFDLPYLNHLNMHLILESNELEKLNQILKDECIVSYQKVHSEYTIEVERLMIR